MTDKENNNVAPLGSRLVQARAFPQHDELINRLYDVTKDYNDMPTTSLLGCLDLVREHLILDYLGAEEDE